MNRKLLSVLIASTVATPLVATAETMLYGRLDLALENRDFDSYTVTNGDKGDKTKVADGWDMKNQSSRIGVKGSDDLGSGLKAVFQAEWAFEASEGGSFASEPEQSVFRNRLAYAGLGGNWGTGTLGRQWTPYYGAVNLVDVFNLDSDNVQYLGTSRTGNSIAYQSPNWNGFSGTLLLEIDGKNNVDVTKKKKGVDGWNLGLQYENGPLFVGFGYLDRPKAGGSPAGSPPDGQYQMTGISGSYRWTHFKLVGVYENGKVPLKSSTTSATTADLSEWSIMGEGYFGNHLVRALYSQTGKDGDGDYWGLGYQYNFSKRTRVYVEYLDGERIDHDSFARTATTLAYDVEEGPRLGLGIRHYF